MWTFLQDCGCMLRNLCEIWASAMDVSAQLLHHYIIMREMLQAHQRSFCHLPQYSLQWFVFVFSLLLGARVEGRALWHQVRPLLGAVCGASVLFVPFVLRLDQFF
jgi:hypothetical protein